MPIAAGSPLDGLATGVHNAAIPSLGGTVVPRLCDYLTVAQASEVLGVSKDTLRRWDRAGRLEARRHPVTGCTSRRNSTTSCVGSASRPLDLRAMGHVVCCPDDAAVNQDAFGTP